MGVRTLVVHIAALGKWSEATALGKANRCLQIAIGAIFISLGQRLGYGLFGIAIVVFFVGLIGDFSGAISTTIIICVVIGSIFLAPAIVVSYAVKAAIRDDIEHGREVD